MDKNKTSLYISSGKWLLVLMQACHCIALYKLPLHRPTDTIRHTVEKNKKKQDKLISLFQ